MGAIFNCILHSVSAIVFCLLCEWIFQFYVSLGSEDIELKPLIGMRKTHEYTVNDVLTHTFSML